MDTSAGKRLVFFFLTGLAAITIYQGTWSSESHTYAPNDGRLPMLTVLLRRFYFCCAIADLQSQAVLIYDASYFFFTFSLLSSYFLNKCGAFLQRIFVCFALCVLHWTCTGWRACCNGTVIARQQALRLSALARMGVLRIS